MTPSDPVYFLPKYCAEDRYISATIIDHALNTMSLPSQVFKDVCIFSNRNIWWKPFTIDIVWAKTGENNYTNCHSFDMGGDELYVTSIIVTLTGQGTSAGNSKFV